MLAVQRLSRGEAGQLNIGYVANIYRDLLPATLAIFAQPLKKVKFVVLRTDWLRCATA